MAFAEDLSVFFADFSVPAMLGGEVLPVILDAAYLSAMGMETTGPAAVVQTALVSLVQHGDALTVGARTYAVTGIQPDGTGITVLQLREA
ncbi:head-tail joining protein [Xylophilus ampelinus]|uniref:Phage head-tail attachment protein n=1 Tax=Xylophilus ampelinus TaxID=54067 RepID=A0A318T1U8_9BURK|nr:head-tail joining protein [Xylophilus ampelinus]MCS4508892.1 head-tail joining protein [Xylophilus ampelinus]PYE79461.1 phage head-tail attachment protein [Xylophilus ampelinus]